jgi:capsular polysaccharide biosynthesis protein
MYEILDGCTSRSGAADFFHNVFLFGDEGIPLQENLVINRFTNFGNDQLLIWLMHHQNRGMTRIAGVTLPLYGDWSSNFWHWCHEALPVALAAHEGGFSGTYLIPDLPFAADSLKLLGIRPDKIRCAEAGDYFLECMCLLPKKRGYDPTILPALDKIRSVFRSQFATAGPERRLYLSRNGSPDNQRKIVNEAELLALLERFGFETLYLEQLSLAEQLAATCNAGAVIGPHGAGMTHCGFLPEGSLVLELFAPSYVNPCVLPVCQVQNHRYFQITSFCGYAGYQHGFDIHANLKLIELTLARELR